jgi:hypothetical protein
MGLLSSRITRGAWELYVEQGLVNSQAEILAKHNATKNHLEKKHYIGANLAWHQYNWSLAKDFLGRPVGQARHIIWCIDVSSTQ